MSDRTVLRRLVTIPAVFFLFALSWIGAPFLVAAALVVDLTRWLTVRRPWMALRLVVFLMAYTLAEVLGLLSLAGIWLISGGGRLFDMTPTTFAVQKWWAAFVLGACRTVFGLRITGTGLDSVHPPPFILVSRHASIIDNLLPAFFISRPHGTHIRYVMKHELLADPALDVAGQRLVNAFVRRTSGESDSELASIRHLAETLPDSDAILIYPEGSRFTAEKRDRSLAILSRRSSRLSRLAAGFTHVLPPRPGGTLALLEACEADVVVMAHRGLDGFARVADIWRGAMVRTHVEVQFWRVSRGDIPTGRAERAEWLFDLWGRIDNWVGQSA